MEMPKIQGFTDNYTNLTSSFFLLQLTYQNTDAPKAEKRKIRKLISLIYDSAFISETKARSESQEDFKKKLHRYRDITRNLILNMLHSYVTGASVSIPKSYNYWHEQHTANPANPSPRHFLYVFNRLVDKGYINKIANYWHSPAKATSKTANKTAKYIASDKLVNRFNDFFITKKSMESVIEVEKKIQSPIQLRRGKLIEHKKIGDLNEKGLKRIKSSFCFIKKYNYYMSKQFKTTFNITQSYFNKMNNDKNGVLNNLLYSKILEMENSNNGVTIRINHRDTFRRFIDDYKKGGRFYGSPVQYIPSDLRKYICINGEKTVEHDYANLHPTMLYMMNGSFDKKKRPENPYYYDKEQEPQKRKEAKLALLVMINSKDSKEAVAALRKGFVDKMKYKKGDYRLKDDYIKNLFSVLENHNKPIAEYFYSNIGITLQNFDSIMAQNIMRRFISLYKPIFCIHDSFVVRKSDGYFLQKLMTEEMEKYYNKCKANLGKQSIGVIKK